MADTDALVNDYIAMWNETDTDHRRDLVARTVTEDAEYVDPVMEGSGVDGIATMIGAAQTQFRGHLRQPRRRRSHAFDHRVPRAGRVAAASAAVRRTVQ